MSVLQTAVDGLEESVPKADKIDLQKVFDSINHIGNAKDYTAESNNNLVSELMNTHEINNEENVTQ